MSFARDKPIFDGGQCSTGSLTVLPHCRYARGSGGGAPVGGGRGPAQVRRTSIACSGRATP
jgi:hypothetical protein